MMRPYTKNNEGPWSTPRINVKGPVSQYAANARMDSRAHLLGPSSNTSSYGTPRTESSVTSRSLSHGGRLVQPSWITGNNRCIQRPYQWPLPLQQDCPSVKVYAQPELSQLTQDTNSFSGDSPVESSHCAGPPAHQNSSQSQSTFASSWLRGGSSSFASRPMKYSRPQTRLFCQMSPSASVASRGSGAPLKSPSRLGTAAIIQQAPHDTILRKKTPGIVGGSSVTEGLCAPSAKPPSPSAVQRGSAAFQKSLEAFHANKDKKSTQQDLHSALGNIGSLHLEKHLLELKRAVLEELTSVLGSEMKKNMDQAMAGLKTTMEAADKERTAAICRQLPSQVQDHISEKLLDFDTILEDRISHKLADLEVRAEANRCELPTHVHDQILDKFLDFDAALEDHISTKFADLDSCMNALKLTAKEQVNDMVQERTEEFRIMADLANDSLQDQTDRCGKEISGSLESIRTETKTQMGLLQDAVKSNLAAFQEVAGPVLEACQRMYHGVVTAPAKLVVDSLFLGSSKSRDVDPPNDREFGSKVSTSRRRTISPVPCKGKRRASHSVDRPKVRGKRNKSATTAVQRNGQSSIEQDSSWSSVGTGHSKNSKVISRNSLVYTPLDLRMRQKPSTAIQTTGASANGHEPLDVDGKEEDKFLLSQGTLSSISCTQTAKTCDLPLKKEHCAVRPKDGLAPVVTPIGRNLSSSDRTKERDLVSRVPLSTEKDTPPQRRRRLIATATEARLNTPASTSSAKSPPSETTYTSAPMSEVRTVGDDVCPSPLTATSFIRAIESVPRRGKKDHSGPTKKSTTCKSTSNGGTKKFGELEKAKVSRRSRHKMTYSKRLHATDVSMINNELDFMSD